jgi:class 3 adenylate cyclase
MGSCSTRSTTRSASSLAPVFEAVLRSVSARRTSAPSICAILIGQRVAIGVEETITLEEVGALTLKGLTQPVVAYNVPLAAIQPALRVIEGGPQSV